MSKQAVFTMKLEPELRAEFMAEAEAAHRPASQVLRELMREFVQRQRESREYDEFLRRKVEAGRASMRAGMGRSNDEVEAEFAARRASVASQSELSGRPKRSKTVPMCGTTSQPTIRARRSGWMRFSATRPPG
jgi:predicted transcriptional regulator